MLKNTAGQRWVVLAYDRKDGTRVTGDAANITAKISKDGAALTATNDVNPTELEDGLYEFDLTQAETNADELVLSPESSSNNVLVIGLPSDVIYTTGAAGSALAQAAITGTISDAGPLAGDFDGDAGLSATDDFYNGAFLVFYSGTYQGIGREISDYTGSSKNFAFTGTGADADAPFPAAPANGDAFIIIGRFGT